MKQSDHNLGVTSPLTECSLEFRCIADEAWYNVHTILEGNKLRVKLFDFNDDHDTVFEPQNFNSFEEIEHFKDRFRATSVQLQDNECHKIVEGMAICASQQFGENDVRFYDAVVDDVIHAEHSFARGEEECTCTFIIVWKNGSLSGCMANKKVENICFIKSCEKLDDAITSFIKVIKERLKNSSNGMDAITSAPSRGSSGINISTPVKHRTTFAQRLTQETRCARRSAKETQESEERRNTHYERIREETDIGGYNNRFVVFIDNIDKELTPSMIVEFIFSHTSLWIQAYISPSLSFEAYTRGAIVFNCEKDMAKVCEFLENPEHIIMSKRRPWVVAEKLSGHNLFTLPIGTLMLKHQNGLRHMGGATSTGDPKIVASESEDFVVAKKLRDLFVEFAQHQKQLHKSLAAEEAKIFSSHGCFF